ncbi:MAG: hypothetical protein FWH07_05800 [Oscillospiraceae bacterium]|nr:hypothetical protein [Oscillospiraceae bacterium]
MRKTVKTMKLVKMMKLVIMKKFNRKRMKRLLMPILTALILISFSGCYLNTPVIDLISPPKLTNEQNEIFNALTNAKGSALILKYPKSGDFLSAFVFNPASGGAMVFYELSGVSGEPTIWLTFLEKKEKWECTYDIPFFATDIEKVEFSHLGDSTQENIIISYSVLNQPGKNLCVISFDGGELPEQVYLRNFCIFYEIGDFNNSGHDMLLSINGGGGDVIQPFIEFAKWQDGSFRVPYSVLSDERANEYVKSIKNVYREKIVRINEEDENENEDVVETMEYGDEKSVLFLEYSRTDTIFGTEIIAWDFAESGGRPHNIVYERNQTIRNELRNLLVKQTNAFTAHAYARDIDGDGIVNAAGNKAFPGYDRDSVSLSERVRAAIWYGITADYRLEKLYYTYLSVNDDYVFFFPEDWEERVTVTVNHEDNEVIFWEFDDSVHETISDVENQFLSIVTTPKGELFQRADRDDYFLINSNSQFDYYVKIMNKSIRTLALKKAFKVF